MTKSRVHLQQKYNTSKQLYSAATQGLINISPTEKEALRCFIQAYETMYLTAKEGDGV